MHYDIIGDLHGHADALEALLQKMDYAPSNGAWRHSERTAVFVGDFIDRGPEQRRTVELVRAMVESGAALAVMGNHELNAIAWHTPHPDGSGDFLRPHDHPVWGCKNFWQHAHFLAEVAPDRQLHNDIIAWFKTLPLWLDLPGIRVVHACWHQRLMDWLAPHLTAEHQLTDDLLAPATLEPADWTEKTSPTPSVFKAVEALLKGIEIPLPPSHRFQDKDGIERTSVRVRWWDENARTYRDAALLADAQRRQLPELAIPHHAQVTLPQGKPLFFGHYWMRGTPAVLAPQMACVDYSVALPGGALAAYRWSGESMLNPHHFVTSKP